MYKDDINLLKNLVIWDECELIKTIENCEIELILDDKCVVETNYPDWYGYKNIDNI